jgi:hypothetical protein
MNWTPGRQSGWAIFAIRPVTASRPRKRRVDARGRSIGGDAQHVRIYRFELLSPAYRSLSVGARALLIEVRALFNGSNNGELFLSVREAARRLDCDKDYAAKLFAELRDRGFIRPSVLGAFNVKATSGKGRATCWILTDQPVGTATTGTKDYMHWQRPADGKNKSRSPMKGHLVPGEGTLPCQTLSTVPPEGTALPIVGLSRSPVGGHSQPVPGRGTQIDLPWEAA